MCKDGVRWDGWHDCERGEYPSSFPVISPGSQHLFVSPGAVRFLKFLYCFKLLIQQKDSWEDGEEEGGKPFWGFVGYIRPPKGLMNDKANISKGRGQWNLFSSNLLNLFDHLAWYTLLLLIVCLFQVISCYLYPLDIFPFLYHICFPYGFFSLHCFTFPQL